MEGLRPWQRVHGMGQALSKEVENNSQQQPKTRPCPLLRPKASPSKRLTVVGTTSCKKNPDQPREHTPPLLKSPVHDP